MQLLYIIGTMTALQAPHVCSRPHLALKDVCRQTVGILTLPTPASNAPIKACHIHQKENAGHEDTQNVSGGILYMAWHAQKQTVLGWQMQGLGLKLQPTR